jgi:Flp pilus assembly protein TadB
MIGPEVAVFLFLSVGAVSVFSFVAVASWAGARSEERKAYYKSETIKKIAESSAGGATAALDFMREQERNKARQLRESLKLGGLITIAVGIALLIFLRALLGPPLYLCGVIPLLIGVALLVYASIAPEP